MKKALMLVMVLLASSVMAIEIPKASAKALGATKGRSITQGLVFINGKYIEPPYIVERWGTGIRINGEPVIGEVIEWTEFIKTQSGVKVTKSESAAAEASPAEEEEEEADLDLGDDVDDSLDDLFDDDPKPKKDKPKKAARKPRVRKPTVTVTYSLEGEFVANDASKALLERINTRRRDIDASLRAGGFYCFGDNYSSVNGNRSLTSKILANVPDLLRTSKSAAEFADGVRAADLFYLNSLICEDIYRNRSDYLKLKRRHSKMSEDEWQDKILNGSSTSPLL